MWTSAENQGVLMYEDLLSLRIPFLPSSFNLPAVHTQLPGDFEPDAVHWIHFPLMALGIGILYSAIIPCFLNLHQYISAQDATQSSSTPNLDLLPAKTLERTSWYDGVLKAWVGNCYWYLVDSIWILAAYMGWVVSPDIASITALGLDSLEFSKVMIGFGGHPSWCAHWISEEIKRLDWPHRADLSSASCGPSCPIGCRITTEKYHGRSDDSNADFKSNG